MATAIDDCDNCNGRQRASSEVASTVRSELEKLNAATDGINHIETEFEEANMTLEKMINDALAHLGKITKKIGKSCIDKAMAHLELEENLKKAEDDLQEARTWLEDAKLYVKTAKEAVTQAEARASSSENKDLNEDIQNEINQANVEFSKAVNRRNEYFKRFEDCTQIARDLKTKIESSGKKYQKQIRKSRPYFEQKHALYKGLEQQRERVKKIEEGIRFAKQQYSEVLGNLENISEEIHRRRRNKAVSMSFTKDGEPNEDFRKSMNDASLNEVDQKKLIEYMTRSSDHLNTDENDNK